MDAADQSDEDDDDSDDFEVAEVLDAYKSDARLVTLHYLCKSDGIAEPYWVPVEYMVCARFARRICYYKCCCLGSHADGR